MRQNRSDTFKRCHRFPLGLLFILLILCGSSGFAETANNLSSYSCVEVEKFQVDRDNFSTKELERAASIPDEDLVNLQHKIVGHLVRSQSFQKVVKAGQEHCSENAIIYGGTVVDYKKGNRAARILIGLGAGKQKFEVQSYLKDKKSGQMLAQKSIIDRKWAGVAGGDEDQGMNDFAEKAVRFIKTRN